MDNFKFEEESNESSFQEPLIICPKCGRLADDGDVVCQFCGARLTPGEEENEKDSPRAEGRKKHTGIIIAAVIAAVVLVGAAATPFIIRFMRDASVSSTEIYTSTSRSFVPVEGKAKFILPDGNVIDTGIDSRSVDSGYISPDRKHGVIIRHDGEIRVLDFSKGQSFTVEGDNHEYLFKICDNGFFYQDSYQDIDTDNITFILKFYDFKLGETAELGSYNYFTQVFSKDMSSAAFVDETDKTIYVFNSSDMSVRKVETLEPNKDINVSFVSCNGKTVMWQTWDGDRTQYYGVIPFEANNEFFIWEDGNVSKLFSVNTEKSYKFDAPYSDGMFMASGDETAVIVCDYGRDRALFKRFGHEPVALDIHKGTHDLLLRDIYTEQGPFAESRGMDIKNIYINKDYVLSAYDSSGKMKEISDKITDFAVYEDTIMFSSYAEGLCSGRVSGGELTYVKKLAEGPVTGLDASRDLKYVYFYNNGKLRYYSEGTVNEVDAGVMTPVYIEPDKGRYALFIAPGSETVNILDAENRKIITVDRAAPLGMVIIPDVSGEGFVYLRLRRTFYIEDPADSASQHKDTYVYVNRDGIITEYEADSDVIDYRPHTIPDSVIRQPSYFSSSLPITMTAGSVSVF